MRLIRVVLGLSGTASTATLEFSCKSTLTNLGIENQLFVESASSPPLNIISQTVHQVTLCSSAIEIIIDSG